jgi:hypothetical protein
MEAIRTMREPAARRYAVLWSGCGCDGSGRLEVFADRFELHGKTALLTVPFGEVVRVAIARGADDRLRGLPVLSLDYGGVGDLRIASLEGTGALYEIARFVDGATIAVGTSGT